MSYIILIVLLLLILVAIYKLYGDDFFSPSIIVVLTYLVSVVCSYVAHLFDLWNFVDKISLNIQISIIVGIISFAIAEFFVRRYFQIKKFRFKNNMDKKITRTTEHGNSKINDLKLKLKKYYFYDCDKKKSFFYFEKKVYLVLLLFVLLSFVLLYLNMASLTGEYVNIPKMISSYRMGSMFSNAENVLKLNFFVTQMYRCVEIIGYIFILILANNLVLKDKISNNKINIFIIAIACFVSLFISGRTLILKYIIAYILCFNLFAYKYNGKSLSIKKIAKYSLIGCVVGIPLFYILLHFLGRTYNSTGFIKYFSFYLGSPIPSLEEIINNSTKYISTINHPFGFNTFIGFQTILNKFHIYLFSQPNSFVWVGFAKELSGNVFTGIYPYLTDFGILGVIVCQFIFGLFISFVYYLAKHRNNLYYMVLLSMVGLYYFDSFRSEKMFTGILSLNMIIFIVYMTILTYLLFKYMRKRI